MKKRFYFIVLVLAVILFALPGLTAKGIGRVIHPRRSRRRLSGAVAAAPGAGRVGNGLQAAAKG